MDDIRPESSRPALRYRTSRPQQGGVLPAQQAMPARQPVQAQQATAQQPVAQPQPRVQPAQQQQVTARPQARPQMQPRQTPVAPAQPVQQAAPAARPVVSAPAQPRPQSAPAAVAPKVAATQVTTASASPVPVAQQTAQHPTAPQPAATPQPVAAQSQPTATQPQAQQHHAHPSVQSAEDDLLADLAASDMDLSSVNGKKSNFKIFSDDEEPKKDSVHARAKKRVHLGIKYMSAKASAVPVHIGKTIRTSAAAIVLLLIGGVIGANFFGKPGLNNNVISVGTLERPRTEVLGISESKETQQGLTDAPVLDNYAVPGDKPKLIEIERLGIASRVFEVGVNGDSSLELAPTIFDTGWFGESARPGTEGVSLIVGSGDPANSSKVFYNLEQAIAGDTIVIEMGNDTAFSYSISSVERIAAVDLDVESLLIPTNGQTENLRLLTDAIPMPDGSNDHVVVYANRLTAETQPSGL